MNTKHHPPPDETPDEALVTRLMLRLPREVAERIKRLARAHDRSLNGEITRAVREYVAREAQEEREQTAERRRSGDGQQR